jgi:D-sedoheptulose 7-phosphate isomerase
MQMQELLSHRASVVQEALKTPGLAEQVERAVEVLVEAGRNGGTVYAFGNGGNSSNADQLVTELIARFAYDRGPLPAAMLLSPGALTAISNDYGYETLFARQLEALVKEGDVAVGYSTSGDSPNVLRGVASARTNGAYTIGFTGASGALRQEVDLAIVVDSSFTPTVEEAHLIITHIICDLVEEEIFGETGSRIRIPERLAGKEA